MNYQRIYNNLCSRGKTREKVPGVFYEKHHIIPRAFGGSNKKENLTLLTLREHFVAHLLLVELYPKSAAMRRAVWFMCNGGKQRKEMYNKYKTSSRTFERLRKDFIDRCSGENAYWYKREFPEEMRKKISEKNKEVAKTTGFRHSNITKSILSEKAKLRKHVAPKPESIQKLKDTWKKKLDNGFVVKKNFGRVCNIKSRQQLRETLGIRIVQLQVSDIFIKEWVSSNEVEENLLIFGTAIRKCCRGKQHTAGGYKWMYADEYYQQNNNAVDVGQLAI